jgi:hypothetical protein
MPRQNQNLPDICIRKRDSIGTYDHCEVTPVPSEHTYCFEYYYKDRYVSERRIPAIILNDYISRYRRMTGTEPLDRHLHYIVFMYMFGKGI